VAAASDFGGTTVKGSLGVPRERASVVFGKAHVTPNATFDLQWFITIEDVPAHVYYRRGAHEMFIAGLDVASVARVRALVLD
jgi:hypothetical protein